MLLLMVYCFLLAEPLEICTKIPPRTDDFAINTIFSPLSAFSVCATPFSRPLQIPYRVAFGF